MKEGSWLAKVLVGWGGWRTDLLSAFCRAFLCGKQNKTLLLDFLLINTDPISYALRAVRFCRNRLSQHGFFSPEDNRHQWWLLQGFDCVLTTNSSTIRVTSGSGWWNSCKSAASWSQYEMLSRDVLVACCQHFWCICVTIITLLMMKKTVRFHSNVKLIP